MRAIWVSADIGISEQGPRDIKIVFCQHREGRRDDRTRQTQRRGPDVSGSGPAAKKAKTAFERVLIESDETTPADANGKLPPVLTHEIVGCNPAGRSSSAPLLDRQRVFRSHRNVPPAKPGTEGKRRPPSRDPRLREAPATSQLDRLMLQCLASRFTIPPTPAPNNGRYGKGRFTRNSQNENTMVPPHFRENGFVEMAKVWPCYEGKYITYGDPWADVSLVECEQKLELRRSDYRWGLDDNYYFGDPNEDGVWRGCKYVVIEVSKTEAREAGEGWLPGRYVIRMTPAEVYDRLGLASATQ